MAKSIRSKSKRKNRTEFRNTIGTDAAKANMAIVQAKMQQCINSGQMNSFDRLSNLFAGNTTNDNTNNATTADADGDDEDVVMTSTALKDSSKIPTKKSKSTKHTSKFVGMYGDKTSKKMGEKKFRRDRTSAGSSSGSRSRSRGRSIEGRKLRSSSKKGGGR